MGRLGLGRDHEAARVLVQAVHDARPLDPADAPQAVAAMGDERVDHGPVGIAGARMHDHAGRLVEHDQMLVLEPDIQGDRLGLRDGRQSLGDNDGESLARFDPMGGVGYGPRRPG